MRLARCYDDPGSVPVIAKEVWLFTQARLRQPLIGKSSFRQ
jgi:hypothetical protein